MKFRPCIDLHDGVVKQIVGGTLKDAPSATGELVTNFVATLSAEDYAKVYQADALTGGHVIMLGHTDANVRACMSAIRAFPGGMQVGGGITPDNAASFLDAGASHVIVTSYIFTGPVLDMRKVAAISSAVGPRRLVLDLSCRRRATSTGFEYVVVTNKWQTCTDTVVNAATLTSLAAYCDEFLVHGVDVEGLRAGIEDDLVVLLGQHSPLPVTYAGGVRDEADIARVKRLGRGRVDVTIGSALDIFGGSLSYKSVLAAVAAVQVEHEPGAFRVYGTADAVLEYAILEGGVMDLYHTFVPDIFRGQGIAAKLAVAACEEARATGRRIRPSCSYIRDAFLPRNDKYRDLVVKE